MSLDRFAINPSLTPPAAALPLVPSHGQATADALACASSGTLSVASCVATTICADPPVSARGLTAAAHAARVLEALCGPGAPSAVGGSGASGASGTSATFCAFPAPERSI